MREPLGLLLFCDLIVLSFHQISTIIIVVAQ